MDYKKEQEIRALSRLIDDMLQTDKNKVLTGDDVTDQRLYLSLWLKMPIEQTENCIKIFNRTFEEFKK